MSKVLRKAAMLGMIAMAGSSMGDESESFLDDDNKLIPRSGGSFKHQKSELTKKQLKARARSKMGSKSRKLNYKKS